MKNWISLIGIALASAISTASLAQDAGQGAPADVQGAGAAPGQVAGASAAGVAGGPGALSTTLTYKSYTIAAGGSSGNLEGAACTAPAKMISGACHPLYNDHVAIINQFPNIPANTWRCGFKNNTAGTVTVYIYTVCAQ